MQAAFAATVPPPVIAANRAQLMTLIATNFLGQNTAAIAANRGPIRRNVGPGRHGDVRLCREFGGNHRGGDAVHRGAADHQPGRVGRAGPRAQAAGTSVGTGVQSTLSQLISTVPTTLQSLRVARFVDVVDIGTFGTPEWASGWVFLRGPPTTGP